MNRYITTLAALALLALATPSIPQPAPTTLQRIQNHNDWGWESWVMDNGLITVATTPAIGARVMQYDLGAHRSIFVNPAETGKTYTPSSNSPWHNYGGYKTWPAPQAEWGWPPPPILDFGIYEARVVADTPDSASIFVASQTERWKTPDLRFERRTTIYPGTSRVRFEQSIINTADRVQSWSVWDVTQHIVNHPDERDFANFWVYFPINPDSRYGESGVRPTAPSPAWTGEVAPGVYGVRFLPENKKIFADSHLGWICYVDERDGYAYAKTFDLFEGQPYPDEGATVEVWLNRDPLYLEVEVVSPIVELAANGGRYTFVEDWWAAKVEGPILNVNHSGAIAQSLHLDAGRLKGRYGVFHEGTARLAFIDEGGDVVARTPPQAVTPLTTLTLDVAAPVLPDLGPLAIQLEVYEANESLVGVLDRLTVTDPITSVAEPASGPATFELLPGYPNPANPSVTLPYRIARPSAVELAIFDASGARVKTLVNAAQSPGTYRVVWDGQDAQGRQAASGVYFYRLETESESQTRRILLLH